MPVRFLSDAELARLSSWPDEIAAEDLEDSDHDTVGRAWEAMVSRGWRPT
jgi:hypothetical protein